MLPWNRSDDGGDEQAQAREGRRAVILEPRPHPQAAEGPERLCVPHKQGPLTCPEERRAAPAVSLFQPLGSSRTPGERPPDTHQHVW